MNLSATLLLLISLCLFAHSLFSLYLMLYTWDNLERVEQSHGPRQFLPPELSFTVLLPARHEEAVIYETVKSIWSAHYPHHLLEVIVVCHHEDTRTIAEAQRAIQELDAAHDACVNKVRVETFTTGSISKPHGLNVGLQRTVNQVVAVFDAEDDIHPDIFRIINTVMVEEECGVVQAGVQLMNFRDHWFSAHNALEYFFWFKSRLHFHAQVGMIPLGGNTVFIRRSLLEQVGGWDEHCLTEDADLGVRLSVLGEPIRVVYDPQYVTREETPDSVGEFVRQRTRWHQGFLQVLRKGEWRDLPRLSQRLLALYTLSYPLFQAALTLFWPCTLAVVVWLKFPVPVTMAAFLPLYALFSQLLVIVIGAWIFTREYKLRFPPLLPVQLILTFIPFHLLLCLSSVRALWREVCHQRNWEKTQHRGAHRLEASFMEKGPYVGETIVNPVSAPLIEN